MLGRTGGFGGGGSGSEGSSSDGSSSGTTTTPPMLDTDSEEFKMKVYDSIEERCEWQNQMCREVLDESLGSKKKKWLFRAKEADKDSRFRENFGALLDLVQQALSE